jgi:hypothetical protein
MPQPIWNATPWHKMTSDQRVEFMQQWCENLSVTVQRQGVYIDNLYSRLRQVEERVAERSFPLRGASG